MSVQGLPFILLRACQVNDQQLMTLLQGTDGLFPADNAQYRQMCLLLRRMGHILERRPGNIASALRGGSSQNATPAFFADGTPADLGNATEPWATSAGDP